MQEPLLIQSLTNKRVKTIVKLRQRSHRNGSGLMLIEGYRELKRALHNKHYPEELYICREFFQGENEPALIDSCRNAGTVIIQCTPAVFQKLAYRDRPEGLLAVAPIVGIKLKDLSTPDNSLIVVIEATEKPGNLGTILRSADSAGANGVIVCDHCTDINNPNVVRASIGAIFALPIVETSTSEGISWLQKHDFRIIATTPHADKLYTDADLTGNIAIALGSEQYGLSNVWLEKADEKLRIPMLGQSDSLNVASAATILLYEAVRQRH
ncbi:MAG: RNA methyltransferase [Kiritimatiellae bacterium]|nr:RNA methyltransferase [Kiritimatiellia bacterium]